MTATILVVDDEPAIRTMLLGKLVSEGFVCFSASTGEEALKLLEQRPCDVVISDLGMPGISGLGLLQEASKRYPRTAFVMATGVDDIRVAVQAMKQGASDYLVKPFQLDDVVASVHRAFEQKRLEVELEKYRQGLEKIVDQRTNELQAAMSSIEQTYDETLEVLGAALDLRDGDTLGHSRRVSGYCLEMARAMGCRGEQLKHIVRGAYLHDVGKMGMPDTILRKKGKLTAEERGIMQSHVRTGYELVSRIPFLAPAAEIILTHHERYDGTGYPQHLVGEQIPLGARIFAVADTLDATTTDRPYRRALSFGKAREEIVRGSGRLFDPAVVRVFVSLPELTWESVCLQNAPPRASTEKVFAARGRPNWQPVQSLTRLFGPVPGK